MKGLSSGPLATFLAEALLGRRMLPAAWWLSLGVSQWRRQETLVREDGERKHWSQVRFQLDTRLGELGPKELQLQRNDLFQAVLVGVALLSRTCCSAVSSHP